MKKKATLEATPLEVAKALLYFGPGTEEARASAMEGLTADCDRESVMGEIFFLRIFAVDFTLSMALGNNSPEKNEILDIYYAFLQEMSKEHITGDEVFMKELKHRLNIYTEAVKTPHPEGPAWTVGEAFSELCGSRMNIVVIMLGSIIFGTTSKSVSDTVNSIRIVR